MQNGVIIRVTTTPSVLKCAHLLISSISTNCAVNRACFFLCAEMISPIQHQPLIRGAMNRTAAVSHALR